MKTFFLLLLLSIAAPAGTIIVSGDGGFANALIGVGTTPLDANNQRFFRNVLGSGTEVRVQSTTSPISASISVADDNVNSFYNGMAGVNSSVLASGFGLLDLAGVNLFVVIVPDAAYTAGEVSALSQLLASGGTVFLLGENNLFTTQNGYLNSLITALGGTIQIVNGVVIGANPVAHPLTVGVGPLFYNIGSTLTGGTALALTDDGELVLATEQVGGNQVPEPSTLLLSAAGLGVALFLRRK